MSSWEGKRVLVTGSEGLMGRPLVAALTMQGAILSRFDMTFGRDVLIADDIRLEVRAFAPDVVFHLAAQSGVEASRSSALDTWRVNVMGTVNVLEACRAVPSIKAVVVASSNHVYGRQDSAPYREDAPLRQLDTYSATKIAADVAARSYWHNYRVPTAVVRNTNCFGPDSRHTDHLIEGTILSLLRGERPVIRGTGQTRKSYLHVDDVVSAYLCIAEAIATGKASPGEAWNVAGQSLSVLEIVDIICRLMGSTLTPVVLGQPNDQSDEYLDARKVKALGWQPTYLSDGLKDTIAGFVSRTQETVHA